MASRPTLLNSCASATTAAEARYRVDILPRTSWRSARVIALDATAAAVVGEVADLAWHGARFFRVEPGLTDGATADPALVGTDGTSVRLGTQLDGADLAVMVAATGDGAGVASAIGVACSLRGIMTAGIILDGAGRPDEVVMALRPHARVLMVTRDEHDVTEVLLALRA